MTRMTDDQLDGTIARYLGWRAERLEGVPDARGMAWRLAGSGLARRPRWQRAAAGLALVGLVVVALAAAIISSRPPAPIGPLSNGPIVIANALGWNGIDPASGAAIQLDPCGGQCEEAMDPRLSADGRTVFFVDPTPEAGDLRSDDPGWAIWSWDRLEGSVRRVARCDAADCQVRKPIPSPDGRYLAYAQGISTRLGDPLATIVVVDARTGQEVRRIQGLVSDRYWVPFANAAWDADGQLLVTDISTGRFRYRRIDVTTGAGADITLPWDGVLDSSPDGTALVMTDEVGPWRLWLLDDRFESTRLLFEGFPPFREIAWSPDGTSIAGQTQSLYDLEVIDIATGARTTHVDDKAVSGQPLWLPKD